MMHHVWPILQTSRKLWTGSGRLFAVKVISPFGWPSVVRSVALAHSARVLSRRKSLLIRRPVTAPLRAPGSVENRPALLRRRRPRGARRAVERGPADISRASLHGVPKPAGPRARRARGAVTGRGFVRGFPTRNTRQAARSCPRADLRLIAEDWPRLAAMN